MGFRLVPKSVTLNDLERRTAPGDTIQGMTGRLKMRDMNQWHKNARVEIAAQMLVDSPNHIYCNYGGIFNLCCLVLN